MELKKNLGLKKKFDEKIFWVQKNIFVQKKFFVRKNFVSKKFWSEINIGSEKFLGATIRLLVCSVIVDFGVVLLVLLVTWVMWTSKLNQKPMIGLCVKFQPSSTPPSDRFWWGVVLLVLLVLVLLVTWVKQSQLLRMQFGNKTSSVLFTFCFLFSDFFRTI